MKTVYIMPISPKCPREILCLFKVNIVKGIDITSVMKIVQNVQQSTSNHILCMGRLHMYKFLMEGRLR